MIEAGANDLLLHVTEFAVILGMFVMLFGLLVPHAVETANESVLLQAKDASASLAKMVASGSAAAQTGAAPQVDTIPTSTFASIIAEAKRQVDDQEFTVTETHLIEVQPSTHAKPPSAHAHVETLENEIESGFDIEEMLDAPQPRAHAEEMPQATTMITTSATVHVEPLEKEAPEPEPAEEAPPVTANAAPESHSRNLPPGQRITWPILVDPDIDANCDLPTRLRLIEALSFIGGNWSVEILARAYEQELDANVRGAIFVALRDARSVA